MLDRSEKQTDNTNLLAKLTAGETTKEPPERKEPPEERPERKEPGQEPPERKEPPEDPTRREESARKNPDIIPLFTLPEPCEKLFLTAA